MYQLIFPMSLLCPLNVPLHLLEAYTRGRAGWEATFTCAQSTSYHAQYGNGRQLTSTLLLQCFTMAAHLVVRSENKVELEKEGLSAKMLNLLHAAEITLVSQLCRTHVVFQR